MSDYDLAINVDPNNFLGHYNRGLLRAQVGDDNRAIEDFDFVLNVEPNNMMALFNRGLLKAQVGDLKGAVSDYSRVLDEYPNFITGYLTIVCMPEMPHRTPALFLESAERIFHRFPGLPAMLRAPRVDL